MNTRFFMFTLLYFIVHLLHSVSTNALNKILGGFDMNIELVPHVVSFMLNGKYACCAAIINKHWTITAAHCVTAANDPYKEISLRSGSSFLYKGGIVHNVVHVIIHENYSDLTNDYDIAVMKVTPSFSSDFTRPVVLAQSNVKYVCTEWGMVCGWGYMGSNDSNPILAKKLQCVLLPLMKKELCCEDYKFTFEITPRMTCYGFQKSVFNSCKGDSGSALINKDGVLLGITSWGDSCGKLYSPGVYSDAIVLRHWIRDKTEKYT